jgi:glycosyltransferase EpsE
MTGRGSRPPRVSVIMGAYNCAATLGASIESMLSQDFRDLELIVCDDGSSDGTADVAGAYARADGRVALLRNEANLGLARTLNRCIEAARGEYLARMDGDDVSRSDRIGKQVAFLDANRDYGICGSCISLFDPSGAWGRIDYPEYPDRRSFLLRSPFAHPSVVFRASVIRAAGGYGSGPGIGRSEDYDLFMRMYASGAKGHNIQECLLEYREELGSFSRRKFKYAIAEARVRMRGFRALGLLPAGIPYAVKPIVIGLIPRRAYSLARRIAFGGRDL